MTTSGQIAQPKNRGEALSADRPYDAGELRELIGANDPTEDLANDVTSELPSPGTRTNAVSAANDGGKLVAEHETADHAASPACGATLRERYVLERRLADGGTSVIFRAQDLRRDGAADDCPRVAIKLLRPEFRDQPQSIARLRREFHQTQSLAHPNVVRFYDLDCDRETWFIAMEQLTGETLGQRLRNAAPHGLPVQEALPIAAACANALAFAHERGVTHGDVKPNNIFVTAADGVRVLDFGVAPGPRLPSHLTDGTSAEPVLAAATRAYASPEVLTNHHPEPRDDVFSLACVIYEMLAGRHPYRRLGSDQARDQGLEIEPLPGLSVRQWRALADGLAWHRELRPADVRELLRVFDTDAPARLPMQAAVALPARVVEGELQRRSTGKWRSITAVLLAIVIAIVLGVLLGRTGFESPGEQPSASPAASTIEAGPAGPASTGGSEASASTVAVADREIAIAPAALPAALSSPLPQPPSGQVSFDGASMVVSARAVVAAIPVSRTNEKGRSAWVAWRVMDGTAAAGRDYGGPAGGVAHFADGHAFRMIYVPIINDSPAAGERSFTVELTGASPETRLGLIPRIMVTIRGD